MEASMGEADTHKKKNGRMKLWNKKDCIIDHKLNPEDNYMISEQFFKKINAIKNELAYKPDISKDSLFSSMYKYEPFDFYEFCNRDECIAPLKCVQLREQSFFLLEYTRNEKIVIEELIEKFHREEDPKVKMCLKEIVRRKKRNLGLVENIRAGMADLIYIAQDAADHFDKMYKIMKNKEI